jgi:hypothetical protein
MYFGKYRAKVVDNKDPSKRGRIRVVCPKVLGSSVSNWCEPCVPVASDYEGDFAVPRLRETVWIEFEEGKADKPIYVGNWWSPSKTPSENYDVDTRVISWGNCKIIMTPTNMVLKYLNSTLTIDENGFNIEEEGGSP